jgi:hypothetical protein
VVKLKARLKRGIHGFDILRALSDTRNKKQPKEARRKPTQSLANVHLRFAESSHRRAATKMSLAALSLLGGCLLWQLSLVENYRRLEAFVRVIRGSSLLLHILEASVACYKNCIRNIYSGAEFVRPLSLCVGNLEFVAILLQLVRIAMPSCPMDIYLAYVIRCHGDNLWQGLPIRCPQHYDKC